MNQIKILIACEESQTVCKAFRARGFEAYNAASIMTTVQYWMISASGAYRRRR